jgi:hypothetical protein
MKCLLQCLILIFISAAANAATYTVTNANASGPGSFLDAIDASNAAAGNDDIQFDIPGMPPHLIPLAVSAAIQISDSVTIDGTTQPDNGYTGACPKIVIDAAGVTLTTLLFQVTGSGVSFSGLWIKNFADPSSYALYITAPGVTVGGPGKKNVFTNVGNSIGVLADSVEISSSYFGCNCDGTAPDPNSGTAISSYSPVTNLVITGNLISGNLAGIMLGTSSAPSGNLIIQGNKIGTDIAGTAAIGNAYNGVELLNITNLAFGGAAASEGNVVSGNGWQGCLLTACSGTVYGNKIGTDVTGNDTLPNDPLNTQYNTAFNCNGYSGIICTLTVGGPGAGEQNVFFGNDIAFNIADSGGHYVVANNVIGQTLSGLVSPLQGLGFQLYYDTSQVLVRDNYIYGTNAAFYATQCKNFLTQDNILGLDVNGIDLPLVNGYSINTADSFIIQDCTIRNCDQGIILIDCNDSYTGMNSIEDCATPIAMRTAAGTCHRNVMVFNPLAYNLYSVNLYNGTGNAANDDIMPPVIEGSNADSTWGSSLPGAIIDLCYDTTLLTFYPQGYSYPLRFYADAAGHWAYHGFLDRPNELTALQTDLLNNSSGFAARLTLGIEDELINRISVYPNPANDYIVIENVPGKEWESWQLLNGLGEIALAGKITYASRIKIRVQHLPPGCYFLKVSSDKEDYIAKLLKQ